MRTMMDEIARVCEQIGRRVQLMEVCGTHTVSIFRSGLRAMLPANLRLISGPGCPVCVTAQRHIDAAIDLAGRDGLILATYGDMLRVPGRCGSLEQRRASGADVRVVQSAMSAVELARRHRDRPVVFLGVGFETTAPATAAAVRRAAVERLENFSVLVSHKLVVPAMAALLEAGETALDGFLCPGHVSVIIGSEAYRPIVARWSMPCVVAGFEPPQIVAALLALVRQVRAGEAQLENAYPQAVTPDGNRAALRLLDEVFEVCDTPWRALGTIGASGLALRDKYRRFDAAERFDIRVGEDVDNPACLCGQVIQGLVEPPECPLFGEGCTPLRPIGPCMVSSEGTCAAWYKYGRGPAAAGDER